MFNALLKKIRSLALTASVAVCVYFIARVILFSYADYNWVEKLFGLLLLLGETYMLTHALGYMLNVFMLVATKTEPKRKELIVGKEPTVAIIVAARHEPQKLLEETIITFLNVDYPRKTIYFLDDSSEQIFKNEADELAAQYGIKVFRRKERHGAKAGIINDFLSTSVEDYIAVFDADQNPMPDFLNKLVPILEADTRLAFVQTPQFYSNISDNPVAKGAAMQQSIFYETICEGKSANNAMFCCGTNVVFRRAALVSVGGFDEEVITEDFATSVKLHMSGWRSVYYNHVSAFGMGPESLPAYFKQQTRWAGGTISVFRRLLFYAVRYPFRLSLAQWWEYLLAGTYYLVGWAFFFLMICPIAFLLFNIPSFFFDPAVYFTAYIPYFSLSLLIFYSTMKERHYDLRDIYDGLVLGSLCFPILMKAAVYGLLGKKMTFVVTSKGKAEKLSWLKLWPYHLMIGLNVAALIAGVMKFHERPGAIGVNMFWAAYHLFILWNIFHFNRLPKRSMGAAA